LAQEIKKLEVSTVRKPPLIFYCDFSLHNINTLLTILLSDGKDCCYTRKIQLIGNVIFWLRLFNYY